MKKLALALVCLVSVAFFASCDPKVDNPEPSIAIITGADYVTGTFDNPQLISMDDPTNWRFGFHAESNAQTNKELASLKVTYTYNFVDDETLEPVSQYYDTVINLAGKTSFDYVDYVFDQSKEIILGVVVTATLTDADGLVATANVAYNIDMPDTPLETRNFTWVREGGGSIVGTGLAEFGLEWLSNLREIYAVITPMENANLYLFQPEVWETVNTEFEKTALFSEMPVAVNQFKEVSCTAANKDYDIVIGTNYEGELRLIHVTHSTAVSNPPQGTKVTITGEWK